MEQINYPVFFKFKTPFKAFHFKITQNSLYTVTLSTMNRDDSSVEFRVNNSRSYQEKVKVVMNQIPSNKHEFEEAVEKAIGFSTSDFPFIDG